jgi:hypothetical protein
MPLPLFNRPSRKVMSAIQFSGDVRCSICQKFPSEWAHPTWCEGPPSLASTPPPAPSVLTFTHEERDFLLWCLGYAEGNARRQGQPHLQPQFDALRLKLLDMP